MGLSPRWGCPLGTVLALVTPGHAWSLVLPVAVIPPREGEASGDSRCHDLDSWKASSALGQQRPPVPHSWCCRPLLRPVASCPGGTPTEPRTLPSSEMGTGEDGWGPGAQVCGCPSLHLWVTQAGARQSHPGVAGFRGKDASALARPICLCDS